jgi:hypothetical protein
MRLEIWKTQPFIRESILNNGDTVVLESKTICAFPPPATRRVTFYLNDQLYRIENVAPYTIEGDTSDFVTPSKLCIGVHSLRVVATDEKNRTVSECKLKFTVVANAQTAPPKIQPPKVQPPKIQPPKANSNKIIYTEDYRSNLYDILKKGKYWVFIWGVKPATNYTHPNVLKRIQVSNGMMRQTCFASDGDYSGNNLNPRTELRLEGIRLPFEKQFRVEMIMNGIAKTSFNFEFFQIMETYPKAGPVFQLDFHRNSYNARFYDIANGHMWRNPIAPFGVQQCHWVVDWRQSSDPARCFIDVTLNGKLIWNRRGKKNTRQQKGSAWLQYGVYKAGNNNQDMFVEIKQFTVSEI